MLEFDRRLMSQGWWLGANWLLTPFYFSNSYNGLIVAPSMPSAENLETRHQ